MHIYSRKNIKILIRALCYLLHVVMVKLHVVMVKLCVVMVGLHIVMVRLHRSWSNCSGTDGRWHPD